ncbi:MAG TPA: VOC family protein [Hyphomicrobiaceae bacterium]|jgi:catechol 2,3-dioxygenase-like lactoylglutathione lyase family enzyme
MAQGQDGELRTKIAPWAHVLAVRDIDSSARYFCEALGFIREWPEATDWRLVRRDGVRVMLGRCPEAAPAAEIGPHSWFAYLNTDGVDRLYAELVANGAIVLEPPADRAYGMREVVVATPDGHRIVFGQDIAKP